MLLIAVIRIVMKREERERRERGDRGERRERRGEGESAITYGDERRRSARRKVGRGHGVVRGGGRRGEDGAGGALGCTVGC